jgi:plastocyanin
MNQSARSRRMLTAVVFVLAALFAVGCGGDDQPNKPPSGGGTLELNSPNLSNGAVFTHTFASAGTFPYHCKIHSSMTSTVTVQAGGAANAAVTITNNAFSSPVTVDIGATVTWTATNTGSTPHTVTSD